MITETKKLLQEKMKLRIAVATIPGRDRRLVDTPIVFNTWSTKSEGEPYHSQ